MWPYGVELAAHVPAGVQAVVYEEVEGASLFEERGQNAGAGSPVQPPAVFERFRYGYAPEPLVLAPQGRQVYAVECATAVHLEGLQDKDRAHTVGHTGLQHDGRGNQTAQEISKAGKPGVRGPTQVKRIPGANVLEEPASVLFYLPEGRLVEDLGYAAQVLLDILEQTLPPCGLVGRRAFPEPLQAEIRITCHPVTELPRSSREQESKVYQRFDLTHGLRRLLRYSVVGGQSIMGFAPA